MLDTSTSPGPARAEHARADVHGDAREVVTAPLALTGVKARADAKTEIGDAGDDRLRAPDRTDGPVERGEEAVAGVGHLAATEPSQLTPDEGVVRVEELPPPAVAEGFSPLRRLDDVREQHRRQGAFDVAERRRADAGQERLHLDRQRLPAGTPPAAVEVAGELDVAGVRDAVGDVPAPSGRIARVLGAVGDECRRLDERERGAHVGLVVQHELLGDRPGRADVPLEVREPAKGVGVVVGVNGVSDERAARPPEPTRPLDCALVDVARDAGRVVRCLRQSGVRTPQHQSRDALGVRRRERDRHRGAVDRAHHRRTAQPDCIHHGSDVVHAVLERARAERPV